LALSVLRLFVIVFFVCAGLLLRPEAAFAQVVIGTPTRTIEAVNAGYCFTDLNTDGTIQLNEIDVTEGSEAMTDAAIPPRLAVQTGGRSFTPSQIHIADNWQDITTQGDYAINIDGICIGGETRTDLVTSNVDTDDDSVADDTITARPTETSPSTSYFDDDGFTFVGGTISDEQIIDFNGQVNGDVAATTGQSNIRLMFDAQTEINGLLNLGNDNAVSNVYLTLAGQIDEVDLDLASDVNLTSSASIGDTDTSTTTNGATGVGTLGLAGASTVFATLSGAIGTLDLTTASNVEVINTANIETIDATNITNGLTFSNAGTVNVFDVSGTDNIDITLTGTSDIGTLRANDVTSPSSYITNGGAIERLEISNSSATDKVEMSVINDGTISANTNNALVIADSNAAGGEIDVTITNNGTITAATSDGLNFSALDGGRLDITNTGSLSSSSSGTSNAINGNGAEGLIFLTNSGTIGNTNSRALDLQNLNGYFRLVNSGSVNSNQSVIDLTGASGSSATAVEIYNGYVLASEGTVSAATSGARELLSDGSDTILLDNVQGNITLANAANASIIAEDSLAISATGVTGNVSLTNAGNIRSFRATPSLAGERAISLTAITGDINFTGQGGQIDALDRTINFEAINGKIVFSNAGTITSTQGLNDADAIASDNYTVRLQRSGAANDENSITNSGTISSSTDHALLLEALACDADAASDSFCLTNSGTLSAGRQFALAGNAISDFKFNNSGTVTARDQAVNLTDLSGAIVFQNSGTISATQSFENLFPDPDATSYGVQLTKQSGVDATIDFTNAASGTISTTADTALRFVGFNGANDGVTFSNSGTISASGNNAVDLTGTSITSIQNTAGGSITAGGNYALLLDGITGASMVLSNFGTLSAGTSAVGDAPAAIYGALAAAVTSVTITNGSGATISSVGNALGNADANSGGTIFLDVDSAALSISNSGTILAGAEASGSAAAVESNNAIRITDIGANAVSVTNSGAGLIKAEGDTAIYLQGDSANMSSITLTNSGTATITADNNVVLLEDAIGAAVTISNSGTISATDGAADHLLNFADISADFSLTNSGVIESAGTRAIYVDMDNTPLTSSDMVVFNNQSTGRIEADSDTVSFLDVNEQVNFDNSGTISATTGASAVVFSGIGAHRFDFNNNAGGTISSRTANAVILGGMTGAVNIVNDGVIEVTAGTNALHVAAGDTTGFTNSGRIEASGIGAVRFDNFVVNAGTAAPQFNNAAGGIIRAASNAFVIDATGATGQAYSLTNAGAIIADVGGNAINMSGAEVNLISSGTISAAASPAVLVGPASEVTISGTVSAGGTTPVAIALEGRGSVVNLSNGSIIIGTIAALDEGTDYTAEEKHRVNLANASNASYYYDFPEEQFRFFVGNEEQTNGSGFSAASSNFEAMTLMHGHHAQGTRNIWRQLGRFSGEGGLRSFAFSDRLNNDRANGREYELTGDRFGLVQSFEQSIFGWFDAELILVANESSFELDEDVFTFDKSYQAVGLGFGDLLSWGPFSVSAMALAGIGQNDVSRLVMSNTSDTGSFDLKASYDTVYLDAFYEALLDMRIWGNAGRLTRRNPFRVHMELGLGGALHSESNDGYREQSFVSIDDSHMQSATLGGRLKFELELRNPTARNDISAFVEFEHNILEINSGTEFDYSVQGAASSADITGAETALTSIAIGAHYQISRDMSFILSLSGTSGDNETDENSLAAALKWRF
jgi:hypothetical protein